MRCRMDTRREISFRNENRGLLQSKSEKIRRNFSEMGFRGPKTQVGFSAQPASRGLQSTRPREQTRNPYFFGRPGSYMPPGGLRPSCGFGWFFGFRGSIVTADLGSDRRNPCSSSHFDCVSRKSGPRAGRRCSVTGPHLTDTSDQSSCNSMCDATISSSPASRI